MNDEAQSQALGLFAFMEYGPENLRTGNRNEKGSPVQAASTGMAQLPASLSLRCRQERLRTAGLGNKPAGGTSAPEDTPAPSETDFRLEARRAARQGLAAADFISLPEGKE